MRHTVRAVTSLLLTLALALASAGTGFGGATCARCVDRCPMKAHRLACHSSGSQRARERAQGDRVHCRIACAGLALASLLLPGAAAAHGIVGQRSFIEPFVT